MHVLRLVGFAGIALLLVSGCVHISDGPGDPPKQIEEVPPPPAAPPPPPPPPADPEQQAQMQALWSTLCSTDAPAGGPITYPIAVSNTGKVDSSNEITRMRRKDRVLWSLTPSNGTKLEIKPFDPKKITLKRISDWEIEGKPKEQGKYCDPLPYDIEVWINGAPVVGDPILIIRD